MHSPLIENSITQYFRKPFLLTHKFGTSCVNEITAERDEWFELPNGAITETRTRSSTTVIRRSRVPAGTTTYIGWVNNQLIIIGLIYGVKSCNTMTIRSRHIEPSYSGWWPFRSPTNMKEARTSSVCTVAIAVNKQSSIQSTRLGLW